MRDRLPRASIVFGFILCLSTVRPAHAETDVLEGGAPGAAPAPPEPVVESADSGGGLFEQSAAAAASSKTEGTTSATPPFTLNGYARGDVFIGRVPGQNAGMIQADYGELSLQLRTAKSVWGDGFADARIRYGLQGNQQGTFVDLREAYANAYIGPDSRKHFRIHNDFVKDLPRRTVARSRR